jgi:AcrR family transcriptional regulator
MKTKDRIIKTAIKLFNDHGTKSITTNHIAKKLQISPGNLYYHFKNKFDIIRSISDKFHIELKSVFKIKIKTINDFRNNIISIYNCFFRIQKSYQFLFIEDVYLSSQDNILLKKYRQLRSAIKEDYNQMLKDLIKLNILKKETLIIIDDLLNVQWIILWHWANHSILDRITYDDLQIKKGIQLSFSIITPHLTSIGRIEFKKTIKTLNIKK